jgi:ATP-dependent phosphoenolpyruvate carboxykinase
VGNRWYISGSTSTFVGVSLMAFSLDKQGISISEIHRNASPAFVKKGVFTIMNYLMPKRGVLSMHCSATQARNGSDGSRLSRFRT